MTLADLGYFIVVVLSSRQTGFLRECVTIDVDGNIIIMDKAKKTIG
ncbi:hypothetical protein GYH30_021753 [Glycine max]|nr:hypothetical protein GYH30_021753 [Glycine max]